jgi:mannose-6-phosphate isomerase-like protein (cupin superfamily)
VRRRPKPAKLAVNRALRGLKLAPCQTRPVDSVLLGPGEGEILALGASHARLIAQGADAGGRVSITDIVLAPGFPGPRPHVHREMTDMFFVLEGTLTVRLGDEEHEAGPGSFILAPPGVAHTFANRSEAPSRVLNVQSPGGLEQYLKEVAAEGGVPDPARMA